MTRTEVERARALATEFVAICDQLLAVERSTYDAVTRTWTAKKWTNTTWVSGALTGRHRRLSLDLTRQLAQMRKP